MNTIDEQIAILQAYKEGKAIEYRCHDDYSGWTDWYTVKGYGGSPYHFNFAYEEYRICKEPEYRPFYGVIEFTPYVYNHNAFVKPKDKEEYYAITRFNDECITLNGDDVVGYDGLFYGYVWADDGSPCGVKID